MSLTSLVLTFLGLYSIPAIILLSVGAVDGWMSGRFDPVWWRSLWWPVWFLQGMTESAAIVDNCVDAGFDCRECDRDGRCIGD